MQVVLNFKMEKLTTLKELPDTDTHNSNYTHDDQH